VVLTQEGAMALWRQLLKIKDVGIPYVHLLGQAHSVVHADTIGSLQAVELVVAGYAPIQLTSPQTSWQLTTLAAGAQAQYPVVTWQLTAACTVYGYWLSDAAFQNSLWGETIASPIVLGPGGGPVQLQLMPTLISPP
jgi:hypothetical protein